MACQAAGQPVISVDTKKKELIGEYKNGGSDYRAAGCPDPVKVHDFVDKNLGKVAPYGIYDVATNTGWVSLGIDHDTAEFAVQAFASRCASASKRWGECSSPLAPGGRFCSLPQGRAGADHRRWRRLERLTRAAVEAGVAE